MRNKKYLLPILGITAISTAIAPAIASCSCSEPIHAWVSPMRDRRQKADDEERKALFILVLDSDTYTKQNLKVKVTGDYADILAIDSFNINGSTIEIIIKCLDWTISGDIPFGLQFTTDSWTQVVKNLVLFVQYATPEGILIEGSDEIHIGGVNTYNAKVTPYPQAPQTVEWSVKQGGTEGYTGEVEIVKQTTTSIQLKGLVPGDIALIASIPELNLSVEKNIEVSTPAVEGITVAGTTAFYSGDTNKFSAIITPKYATKNVNWSIHDNQYTTNPSTKATVVKNADGTATVVPNSGLTNRCEVWVRATATDGTELTGQAKTTIKIPLNSFEVQGDATPRLNQEEGTYVYSINRNSFDPKGAEFEEELEHPIQWFSSDTTIAEIDPYTGVLKPKAYGTANITAKVKSKGVVTSKPFKIEVKDAVVEELTINGASTLWDDAEDGIDLQYHVSYSPTESHEGVTWHSSNDAIKINKVDNTSAKLAYPLVAGKTAIWATANDTGAVQSNVINLEIKKAAKSIKVTSGAKTPQKDSASVPYQYGAEIYDKDGQKMSGDIIFSAEQIAGETGDAEMTADGKLTPTAKGKMNVYAKFRQDGREELVSEAYPIDIAAPTATGIDIIGANVIPFNSDTKGETSDYEMKITPDDAEIDVNNIKWTVTNGTGEATVSPETKSKKVTLTPSKSGTIKLKAEVLGTSLSKEIDITITSAWHSIFTIDQTDPTNKIVTGFKSDYADYINGYVLDTKTLTFPTDKTVTKVKAEAFKNLIISGTGCATAGVEKVIIPANITEIGDNAFNNDTSHANSIVKQVEIQGATTIGEKAFINNDVLQSVDAQNGVTIGTSAFEADNALTLIYLGSNKSTVIGDQAFANIKGASEIKLYANPLSIGNLAFNESSKLVWDGINNVTAITSIGESAFAGTQLLSSGKTFTVNNKLANATIGDAAFFATGIEQIKLPEQTANTMYANWGRTLFGNCTSLNYIDLSDWSSIPSNLSAKEDLDLFIMSGTENTNTWYYKSTLSESALSTLSDWMDIQLGDMAPNWDKAKK